MKITELADSPYRYSQTANRSNSDDFVFQTDKLLYKVRLVYKPELMTVAFVAIDPETKEETQEVLNTGNSLRVFATVADIVRDQLTRRHPKQIAFAADSSAASRVSLYQRIARNIQRYLPDYRYSGVEQLHKVGITRFVLERNR